MAQKKEHGKVGGEDGKKIIETKGTLCITRAPGPQYKLKTLVGYKNHCISKYRNPAYTFGGRHPIFEMTDSPGPIYMIDKSEKCRPMEFTFGHALKHRDIQDGPGPKYKLPDVPRGPSFSLKWRTKLRKSDAIPGPYYVKHIADAPAFTMGRRITMKPKVSAGFYPSYNLEVVKSRAPKYTMAGRRILQMTSESPGPIYAIRPSKPIPAFTFGIKHHECAPPYITECDKQC